MDEHEKNRASYPNGWLIKAFRNLNIPSKEHEGTIELFAKRYKEKLDSQGRVNPKEEGTLFFTGSREVSYGNYDRIQIIPVNNLAELTREANQTHDWLGSSQSILLYKWKNEQNRRCFQLISEKKSERAKIGIYDENGNAKKNEFFAVSFCYISDDMRSRRSNLPYSELLDQCENQILNLVDAFNQHLSSDQENNIHTKVSAEVFGSLSAAEIVILWSAKQYSDVMYLIECIRDFCYEWNAEKISLFRTTYTMIAFPELVTRNDVKSWEDMQDPQLNEILGEAFIQFATQEGAGEGAFASFGEFFSKCIRNASAMLETSPPENYEWIRCAGEYDLIVKVESKYVTRLFCNPQIWHTPGDTSWRDNPGARDATCNVYHPTFNWHVLYSFTRLSYQKNKDLPIFARGDDKEWEATKRHLGCINSVQLEKPIPQNRLELIKFIQEDKRELNKLLDMIRDRLPQISNLSAELNQLFSDYVQCMCASADGLWIDDYQQLFKQMLKQLVRQIGQTDVWRQYPSEVNDGHWEARWNAARKIVSDINKLIRSLHQQTNHISTSNKLFFREQEIHFGYSAQHDLILHAYYGIAKRLIETIYNYSTTDFQSTLYPLINFRAGDHIESYIYSEESAELYLKTETSLHPRIMVIHIPLDGMDNLMYYIPMMVHEVFHYAAPRDRNDRNKTLAKIAVGVVLENSISKIFNDLYWKKLNGAEKSRHENNRRLQDQIDRERLSAEKAFRRSMSLVLYNSVEKHIETIYQSLEGGFFTAELNDLSGEELARIEGMNELRRKLILRSWFLVWLKNWLYGFRLEQSDVDHSQYSVLSDFFEPLFKDLSENLAASLKRKEDAGLCDFDVTLYNQTIDKMKEQIDAVLYAEDGISTNNESINQQIMKGVRGYLESVQFDDLFKQLDEIFPDVAMVTITKMSPSGYMLQVALDLDRQMYSCNDKIMNDFRFAAVLYWLINHLSKKRGLTAEKYLEQELVAFQKLYQASYGVVSAATGGEDKGLVHRAERWSTAFREICYEYKKNAPMNAFHKWVDELIQKQMLPCLTLEGEIKQNIEQLFQRPYHEYLKILQEERPSEKQLSGLFQLSIKTVLGFQWYKPLKDLNKAFEDKSKSEERGSGTEISSPKISFPVCTTSFQDYCTTIHSEHEYFQVINKAVEYLYSYRKADHVNSSTGMWYRGVSNADNNVIPSGFVHFAEDAGLLNGGLSKGKSEYTYLDAQRHNYESFRYSAEGANSDISPAQYRCAFNYLTLMQHYTQHTNLLDWSEDFFAASYFSLEHQINLNDDYPHTQKKQRRKGTLKDSEKDAALYILDPVRFNLACQTIENEKNGLFELKDFACFPEGHEIPNLSISENQSRMQEYHEMYPCDKSGSGIVRVEDSKRSGDIPVTLIDFKKNRNQSDKLNFHLPRAVYAAKLNARIRAQSGLFVAFSLLSRPIAWKGKKIVTDKINPFLFHYQALEQIQDYYLAMSRTHYPFMMKIRIPSSLKMVLGKMLYDFGLSMERIYPELQNNRNR